MPCSDTVRRTGGTAMTTSSTQINDFFSQMTAQSVEVFASWADASQKVLRELVDLFASTAKEGVRLYAEIQSSAVEAVKDGQALMLRRQADLRDAPKDPVSCYQTNVLESVEGAQKTFKLFEANAQAMTRSAERPWAAPAAIPPARSIRESHGRPRAGSSGSLRDWT